MPGTDDSPIAALDPTPSRLRVSAGFVVGLSVSLVLHGVLLGLLLMRQGAAGTQSNAPASPLLIDWQAAVPQRPVPAPPRTAPARTPTPTMRESASAAPRSLVAAPAPHRDAADERSAVNTLPMPPTTVETGARDDATTAAPPQPASAVSGDGIKTFSDWPTIPQLYVRGEFIGGCDILREMFQAGELAQLMSDKGVLGGSQI